MAVATDAVRGPELDLLDKSARELDELFRSPPAGPIPDGDGRGTVPVLTGTPLSRLLAAVAYPLLWQMVVERTRGKLLNRLTPLCLRAVRGIVTIGPRWVDGQDCIVIDYSRTSLVGHWVRDEIRLVAPGTYLGVVWLSRYRLPGLGFALLFTQLEVIGRCDDRTARRDCRRT